MKSLIAFLFGVALALFLLDKLLMLVLQPDWLPVRCDGGENG